MHFADASDTKIFYEMHAGLTNQQMKVINEWKSWKHETDKVHIRAPALGAEFSSSDVPMKVIYRIEIRMYDRSHRYSPINMYKGMQQGQTSLRNTFSVEHSETPVTSLVGKWRALLVWTFTILHVLFTLTYKYEIVAAIV